jgi:signal transduction histidine kinase
VRGPITEAQKDDIERINRSQRHLLSLINDILNYAKLESGHLELTLADVPVADLLRDVEPLVLPQLAAKGLGFAATCDDPPPRMRADAEKVRQILLNLLTNAVKFTDAGGRVTLACDATADRVLLRVHDTGRGIPHDRLDGIFEPFVQIDRHLTPGNQQGVGLGLAISRGLARRRGGDLTVESVVGEGSTFTLALPKA